MYSARGQKVLVIVTVVHRLVFCMLTNNSTPDFDLTCNFLSTFKHMKWSIAWMNPIQSSPTQINDSLALHRAITWNLSIFLLCWESLCTEAMFSSSFVEQHLHYFAHLNGRSSSHLFKQLDHLWSWKVRNHIPWKFEVTGLFYLQCCHWGVRCYSESWSFKWRFLLLQVLFLLLEVLRIFFLPSVSWGVMLSWLDDMLRWLTGSTFILWALGKLLPSGDPAHSVPVPSVL